MMTSDKQYRYIWHPYIEMLILVSATLLAAKLYSINFSSTLYRFTAFIFIFGAISLTWLFIIKPKYSLLGLLFVFLFGARLSSEYMLSIGHLRIPLEAIILFALFILYYTKHPISSDAFTGYLFTFVIVLIIVSMVHPGNELLTILLAGPISQFIAYLLFRSVFKTKKRIEQLARGLSILLFLAILYGFVQPFLFGNWVDFIFLRIPSFFYNPNIYASVLILLWPMILISYSDKMRTHKQKTGVIIYIFLCLIAILLTGSRAALIIALVQSLIMLLILRRRSKRDKRKVSKLVMIGVACVIIVFAFWSQSILGTVLRRFEQIDFTAPGNSASERILGAKGAIEIGLSHPLWGVGLGNFEKEYPKTAASQKGILKLESAHNYPLNLFAEAGILVVLLWAIVIAKLIIGMRTALSMHLNTGLSEIAIAFFVSNIGEIAYTTLFYDDVVHKGNGFPMVLWYIVIAIQMNLVKIKENKVE